MFLVGAFTQVSKNKTEAEGSIPATSLQHPCIEGSGVKSGNAFSGLFIYLFKSKNNNNNLNLQKPKGV